MIQITKREFGVFADGTGANLYTVSNGSVSFSATNYGCVLTSILLPNKFGAADDVLLGFDSFDSIVHRNQQRFGSLIGRYANRIRNAEFTLDGKTYHTDKNFKDMHTLHGGFYGYDQVLWQAAEAETAAGKGMRFTRVSPDGEQGYPGNLQLEVLYLLNERNEITLEYTAKTDKATPVNLTNHAYFNLKGHKGGSVAGHEAQINAAQRLEIDDILIPTGKLLPVAGSVFDFTTPKALGAAFDSSDLQPMFGGYDVCYVFGDAGKNAGHAQLPTLAVIREPESGRTMTCRSNQPCMQLYTANLLSNVQGKGSAVYGKFSAFCLETQQYTNAPNIPAFPSPVIQPGGTYHAVTVYAFA